MRYLLGRCEGQIDALAMPTILPSGSVKDVVAAWCCVWGGVDPLEFGCADPRLRRPPPLHRHLRTGPAEGVVDGEQSHEEEPGEPSVDRVAERSAAESKPPQCRA